MRNIRLWLAAAFCVAVVAAALIGIRPLLKTAIAAEGDKAPAFTLKDLDGKKHSLKDFKGKVVLINFFASW